MNAKWGNNPFVTQQVGANLTTTGGGIKMFTHLVFDWFQYKRYERKFPHNLNISIQIFLRVLLYQFLLDRQNGDTTICQMSDTGLGFQSYFFCPYWFNIIICFNCRNLNEEKGPKISNTFRENQLRYASDNHNDDITVLCLNFSRLSSLSDYSLCLSQFLKLWKTNFHENYSAW